MEGVCFQKKRKKERKREEEGKKSKGISGIKGKI